MSGNPVPVDNVPDPEAHRKEELAKELVLRKKISYADALKQVDGLFKDGGESKRDRMLRELGVKSDIIKNLGKATQGMDPNLKTLLTTETIGDLSKMGNQPGEEDEFDKDLKSIMRQTQRLKMLEVFAGGSKNTSDGAITPEAIAKAMGGEMSKVTETMGKIQSRLDGKEKSETKVLMEEFLKRVSPKDGEGGDKTDPFIQFDKAQQFVDKTKGVLEKAGYKIDQQYVTKDQLPDMMKDMSPDDLATLLESKGYKISGKPVPYTEHEKALLSAKEEGKVEASEDRSAEIAASTIEHITDNFFEKVLGPLLQKDWNQPMSDEEYKQQTQEPSVETETPEKSD